MEGRDIALMPEGDHAKDRMAIEAERARADGSSVGAMKSSDTPSSEHQRITDIQYESPKFSTDPKVLEIDTVLLG